MDTTHTTGGYDGPAGVVLTPEECLIVWQHLTRIPLGENAAIREKLARYLERKADE